MTDELQFHLDARTKDLIARGLTEQAARRQARIEFGAVESWKDSCREARGWTLWRDLRSDVRYAVRWLRRSPGFTTAALLSLALGVGANTLVFSAVNALVLRPLPVERPSEVFFLESRRGPSHSFPTYRALHERGRSAAMLAGYRIAPMNVTLPQGAVRIWGYLATGNYFDMLGIQPAAGRLFHDDDDRRPGASPYVVLSHDCWRTRFFADAGVVGRSIAVNGRPFTILGVAPPGFYGTERFYRAEMWVPIMMQAEIEPGNPWLEARNTSNTWVIGRANPGMSFAAVESALNIAGQDLAREYPNETRALQFKLTTPGIIGDALGTPVRAFALGVQALAGLVLLVACLNVATLLLARGSDRQRELSIRLSSGAGRWRLMRQLLTESLLIAAAGGALGALIAVLGARVVSAWRAPVDFPVVLDVRADATVLLFAIVVVTFAGLVFGVAPARQAARTDPNLALKGSPGSRHGSRRLWMFRESLVAVQVALCCVLVSACLLSLIGLRRAVTLPIGFNPDGVAMAGVDLALAGYDKPRGEAFQRLMLDTISRLPGVESAAYSNSLPLTIDQSTTSISLPGGSAPAAPPTGSLAGTPRSPLRSPGSVARAPSLSPGGSIAADERISAIYYQVSPRFFRTMGIPLLAGREFTWSDTSAAPRVAVVNRSFSRAVLREENPVGRRFPYGRDSFVEVVGLVEDGKYQSLAENPRPAIFWPMLQSYNSTTLLLVRSSLPADGMVQSLRQAIATVDPALPIHGAGTAQEMLRFARFPSRAAAMALGAFGFLAMTLAAVGLHGVVAYVVARREREIGIRLAIGARPNSVLRLVLVRMGLVLGTGSLIGLTLVLLAGGAIGAVVPEASPRDPGVIALAMAGMLGIGIAAAWSPARRALRISLTSALRSE